MGRTVPSYRQALEAEAEKWRKMERVLRPEHAQSLEQLIEAARSLASAASYAALPSVADSMLLSALIKLQCEVNKLRRELEELKSGR